MSLKAGAAAPGLAGVSAHHKGHIGGSFKPPSTRDVTAAVPLVPVSTGPLAGLLFVIPPPASGGEV